MPDCRREYIQLLMNVGYSKTEAARIHDQYERQGDLEGLGDFIIASECCGTLG